MRTGLEIGEQIEISITVADHMRASLLGQPVHPLYGTAAMIEHMEWAARQHILPYLEPGEEGVGHHVDVKHLAPAPMGAIIRILSTVSELQPRRVTSQVEAWWNDTLVGQGTLVQALAPMDKLYACAQPKAPPTEHTPSKSSNEDSDEEIPAPPPALLVSRNGQERLQIEVQKWENGMFACSRYDEWLVCRIQIENNAATPANFAYKGAFLLRYELEEWLEAVQAMSTNQRSGFLSDFLEPVLKIDISAGEVGEWSCTFKLTPPDQTTHQISLLVDPAALKQFGTEFAAQLEGFPSRL